MIQAGPGVTVEGIGTVERPYEIGAESSDLSGRLEFVDSSTIDFTTTGFGSQLDPYVITADSLVKMTDLLDVDDAVPANGDVPVWVTDHWEFQAPAGVGGSGIPNGGTTGQVLTKLSNADGNANWQTPAASANLVGFSAYRNTQHSLTTNGFNTITSFTEDYDTNAAFNPTTGLYVVPSAGVYAISGSLLFDTNITGRRFLQIEVGTGSPGSNVQLIRQEISPGNSYLGMAIYREVTLAAGVTLRLVAYQTSGAALNGRGDLGPTTFNARKVG